MKIVNEAGYKEWKHRSDELYYTLTFRYVERWANIMEAQLEDCAQIEDIALETAYEANNDYIGITVSMHRDAVEILWQHWAYGEALRTWFNKRYNYDGPGIAIIPIMVPVD